MKTDEYTHKSKYDDDDDDDDDGGGGDDDDDDNDGDEIRRRNERKGTKKTMMVTVVWGLRFQKEETCLCLEPHETHGAMKKTLGV